MSDLQQTKALNKQRMTSSEQSLQGVKSSLVTV